MADLTITTYVTVNAKYTKSLDLTTVKDHMDKTYTVALSDGTSSSQADQLWHDTRQIAASSTDSLDLTGGVTDAFGAALTFVKIRGLVITNLSNTQTLTVGNAASDAWVGPFGAASHTVTINPGATAVLVNDGAGYAVTASSADHLKIANGGSSACSYDIILWGTSA